MKYKALPLAVLCVAVSIALSACGGAPVASSPTAPADVATAQPAAQATTQATAPAAQPRDEPTAPPAQATEPAQEPTQGETALHIDITPPVAQVKKVTHFEASGFAARDTVDVIFLIPNGTFPTAYDAGNVTADATGKASYDLKFDGTGIDNTPGWWIVTFKTLNSDGTAVAKAIQRGFELTYADDAALQGAQVTAQAQVSAEPVTITPATVTKFNSDVQFETSAFKPGENVEIYVITPEGLYNALPLKGQVTSTPLRGAYNLHFAYRPIVPGTWRLRIVSATSGKVGEGSFTVAPEAFATPVQ